MTAAAATAAGERTSKTEHSKHQGEGVDGKHNWCKGGGSSSRDTSTAEKRAATPLSQLHSHRECNMSTETRPQTGWEGDRKERGREEETPLLPPREEAAETGAATPLSQPHSHRECYASTETEARPQTGEQGGGKGRGGEGETPLLPQDRDRLGEGVWILGFVALKRGESKTPLTQY
jgi:hypothetical protein